MFQRKLPLVIGLYPRLLGPRWRELPDAVRRLHCDGGTIHAIGSFRVRHGSGRLVRLLARLAGLPVECDVVAVRLVIKRSSTGERWHRLFAGRPMTSRQW